MATARRQPLKPEDLPPDAAAKVAHLPPWLRDVAASAFQAVDDQGAQRLVKERQEAERTHRQQQLADIAAAALAGDWGKETKAAAERVLAGVSPRQAQWASLVLIEGIVREEKIRRQKARRPPPAGRGAP
jgi:hypothetical protein